MQPLHALTSFELPSLTVFALAASHVLHVPPAAMKKPLLHVVQVALEQAAQLAVQATQAPLCT